MHRRGFTLIELLVVIGIVGILVAALVPTVKRAQAQAKEAAVKANCSTIEAALTEFNTRTRGAGYPGVAIDPMAPWDHHALGDPEIYNGIGTGVNFDIIPGRMVNGVLGGYRHYNNTPTNAAEQLASVKNTALEVNTADTPRYFDSLFAAGSINEYPGNPFAGRPMANVFRFALHEFGGNNGFSPENNFAGAPGANGYQVWLRAERPEGVPATDPRVDRQDTAYYFNDTLSDPAAWWETDFSPGDFAYVPVLTQSVYEYRYNPDTLEDDRWKWGTLVGGYMLFGYGARDSNDEQVADARAEFERNGLPGYAGPGVDTTYEAYVLSLFNGAVYFNKKGGF